MPGPASTRENLAFAHALIAVLGFTVVGARDDPMYISPPGGRRCVVDLNRGQAWVGRLSDHALYERVGSVKLSDAQFERKLIALIEEASAYDTGREGQVSS